MPSTPTMDSTANSGQTEMRSHLAPEATSLPEGDIAFQNLLKTHNLDASNLQQAIKQAGQQDIDWDAELQKLQSQKTTTQGSASISAPSPESGKEPQKKRGKLKEVITDFAYSLNHAIVCTLTDPLTDIPIGAVVSGAVDRVKENREKGEDTAFLPFIRDHLKGEWADLKERKIKFFTDEFSFSKKPKNEEQKEELKALQEENIKRVAQGKRKLRHFSPGMRWLLGEFAGDFGAVIATVIVKHFLSPLAKGIEWAMRPVAEPLFRRSVTKSITKQFDLYGLDKNSPAFEQAVNDSVKSEIKNLPNAVLWTILSPVINVTLQKKVLDSQDSYLGLYAGKIAGSIVTSSLTVGMRSLAPSFAQHWDEGLSIKTAKPVSKMIGFLSGIQPEELHNTLIKQIKDEHGVDKESFIARYGNAAKREEAVKPASRFTEREDGRSPAGATRGV